MHSRLSLSSHESMSSGGSGVNYDAPRNVLQVILQQWKTMFNKKLKCFFPQQQPYYHNQQLHQQQQQHSYNNASGTSSPRLTPKSQRRSIMEQQQQLQQQQQQLPQLESSIPCGCSHDSGPYQNYDVPRNLTIQVQCLCA